MMGTGLRSIARSPVGLTLKSLLGMPLPEYIPRLDECVSDLFIWRSDDVWETRFDLFHIAGIVNPRFTQPYPVLIHVYDKEGSLLYEQSREVQYGEVQKLRLEELLGRQSGFGSFALFHLVDNAALFGKDNTCLVERGYTSFRRKTDGSLLCSYVHGNGFILGCDQKRLKVRNVGRPISRACFYRPQVLFGDCDFFELFLVNPTSRPIQISLELFDSGTGAVSRLPTTLPVRGAFFFSSQNGPKGIETIKIHSEFPMLRPLIFKFYATHFDVLHG